ncbi:hypothetical protein B0T21DRAFT_126370 [Apiosordaria backusii]|uniref:Uncharacterized protein n=1 Tax=Apiosordaria backusii TaxID=314023 RepID=A0AA40EMW1_9PEZI|nr:hypothetical protein B0T21DRAFT_126370 [Apiosordaria backusii]
MCPPSSPWSWSVSILISFAPDTLPRQPLTCCLPHHFFQCHQLNFVLERYDGNHHSNPNPGHQHPSSPPTVLNNPPQVQQRPPRIPKAEYHGGDSQRVLVYRFAALIEVCQGV